jgi:23S rRNA (cytosine1962-C5)-methyltransferase
MLSGIAVSGQAAAVTSMRSVFLKEGRERPVLRGHPWIFSGAIERVAEDSDEAGLADVFDAAGRWLARGLFSPKSQIRVRVLTASDEAIDHAFFAGRLARASAWRKALLAPATDAYRLINGEGDFLPGLVVDRYGDFLVCQFVSAAMDGLKGLVVDALAELFGARGIYERSEGGARAEEGLEPSVGLLAGEEPPAALRIEEHGLGFLVDIREGQKTGFFLDQRDHRLLLRELAHDRSVLNCFAYTGAFALSALKGGAREVVSVESSRAALDLARSSAELNGLSAPAENFIQTI